MKILYRSVIKTRTNGGDIAKQYFIVSQATEKGYEAGIIIHKYVLSNDMNYEYASEYEKIREYKGRTLYKTAFSIKVKTLMTVLNDISERGVLEKINNDTNK